MTCVWNAHLPCLPYTSEMAFFYVWKYLLSSSVCGYDMCQLLAPDL